MSENRFTGNADDLRPVETPEAKAEARPARAEYAAERRDKYVWKEGDVELLDAAEAAALPDDPAPLPLAIIEFPNGARIAFGEDGRWSGEAALADEANAFVLSPIYRPNVVRETAEEIAAALGGVVAEAVDCDDSDEPDPDDGRVY